MGIDDIINQIGNLTQLGFYLGLLALLLYGASSAKHAKDVNRLLYRFTKWQLTLWYQLFVPDRLKRWIERRVTWRPR